MKFNSLTAILILFALFAISLAEEAPGYCKNIKIDGTCGKGAPNVKAQAGLEGKCETYDSECLVEKLNCLRYSNGDPLLIPC